MLVGEVRRRIVKGRKVSEARRNKERKNREVREVW